MCEQVSKSDSKKQNVGGVFPLSGPMPSTTESAAARRGTEVNRGGRRNETGCYFTTDRCLHADGRVSPLAPEKSTGTGVFQEEPFAFLQLHISAPMKSATGFGSAVIKSLI